MAPLGLPPPDTRALAHGARVLSRVEQEIDAAGGCLPFDRYMNLVLHAPGLGYYSAGSQKFGPEGDFVTAPEVSPLFAACLARPFAEILRDIGEADILEVGAGSGILAARLLPALVGLGASSGRYRILETSADLRARQEALLQPIADETGWSVEWLEALPRRAFRGILFANELLDAMPIHRLRRAGPGQLQALCVQRTEQGLSWAERPAEDPRLTRRVEEIVAGAAEAFAPHYCFEINLAMEGWLAAAAQTLERGMLLLVDYGFPRREYYHPERDAGTLMCHYRHRAHGNPLVLPGLQDITAHVDFTALAEAGARADLELCGYTTQAWFLFGCGLDALAAPRLNSSSALERARAAQEVQRLTLPGEMGERFKVIAWRRGVAVAPPAFRLRDERYRL